MTKKFTTKPIGSSNKLEKENKKTAEAEIALNNLYNKNEAIIVKPHNGYSLWLLVILITILFSFVTVFSYNTFFKVETFTNGEQKVVIEKQEDVTVTADEQLDRLEEQINPVVVNFYLKPDEASGNFYQDIYSFGSGLILTSDGWLVTTQKVMDKIGDQNYIILTHDYHAYQAEKILRDPISPLIFIKIKATNLTVAKFSNLNKLSSGQSVYGFIASYPKAKSASLHLADLQLSTLDDVVASTEKFSHFISCREGYNDSLVGAPIVNMAGEIIAIINDNKTATPIDYFSKIINDLGKTKKINRVYFGVNYISLSKYPKIDKISEKFMDKGALLSGFKNLLAVEKLSPADKADLQVGDIILAVEDETVNGHKSLTAIIQEYDTDKTVKLLILRNGKEKTIEVELSSLD